MTARAQTAADRLHQLAREIGQLRPDWQQPERFFHRRSELECEAKRLAHELARDGQHRSNRE